jgi:hypothetical protein
MPLAPLNQLIVIGEAVVKMQDGTEQKVQIKIAKQFLDELNKIIRTINGG